MKLLTIYFTEYGNQESIKVSGELKEKKELK